MRLLIYHPIFIAINSTKCLSANGKNWDQWKKEKKHQYLMWVRKFLSRHVRLCATPETAAHQAPPSLGFSRQEHWSGLPFPSPMHESEKWKWSRAVVSDSLRPYGLQPTSIHGIFQARVLEWGAIAFSDYFLRQSQIYKKNCDASFPNY